MEILFWGITSGLLLFFIAAAITSFAEREVRAAIILALSGLIFSGLLAMVYLTLSSPLNFWLPILILVLPLLLLFIPTGRYSEKAEIPEDYARFHEADAVLSRRTLTPGSEEYNNYYAQHPDFKEVDDKARRNPGLLKQGSKYYDPVSFRAAEASFILTDHLHGLEKVPVAKERQENNPSDLAKFIQSWMLKSGAHSVGFTPLKDYHLYSHKGRGERRGELVENNMDHAIAFTVEMDHDYMSFAPEGPTVVESADQYLRSGTLATKLALFIKELGYEATAHIDGNYEVICPLVAADAGLGVIGRMGLLMTPVLGPRVRIAVVTTRLPLQYKTKKSNHSALQFCEWCKKCSDNCPVNAIPDGPRSDNSGSERWQIDSERCYSMWTIAGTDCGRCVISCPYSHPNNWFHGFIRWGIKNNLLFRRIAVKLDDVFYGRKTVVRRLPDWLTFKKQG